MNNLIQRCSTCLLLMMLFYTTAWSQEVSVTGTITDANEAYPLPGVTVLIKGTTTGTTSNTDGFYSISAPTDAVLVYSYIGYETAEIAVANRTVIDVEMTDASEMLEEIILIGYGTQRKSDRTGAVSHITSAEMNTGVITDPVQSIQGKMAGVMVSKKGGDPNSAFEIKIRGASALTTQTEPLYVVDGVPGVDPTTIAPEDIESWNILKDASSTAIYGSRGAHGVVIITTKRGPQIQEGSQIDFNSYVSIDQVANRLNFLTADQVRQHVTDNNIENFNDGGATTNWVDEIYRTGMSQNYNLAVSGRNEHSAYRASVAHSIFEGVIIGSSKERTIARINLDQEAFNGRLKIQSGMSGTFEKNDYVDYGGWGRNSVQFQAFQRNPTDPVYDEEGDYYEIERDFDYYNPVALVNEIQNERDAKRFFSFFKADLDIYNGFAAGVNVGYTRDDHENFYFEPSTLYLGKEQGMGRRSYSNYESRLIESTLRYANVFNLHDLNVVAGHTWQEDIETGFHAEGRSPFINYSQSHNMGNFMSVTAGRDIGSTKQSNLLISFFGRAMYNYDSRYFFTTTMRRDGSSKFGENNRWGWFPSASAMWNLTGEEFLLGNRIISNLRLRVGFGLSGNQQFGRYRAIQYYERRGTSINFETGEETILYEFAHTANPDLRWETNEEINIGVDFGFLNNRISGTAEYFRKNTYDLIGEYSVPVPPNPVGRYFANIGQIQVNGFELFLQVFLVQANNLSWKTALTFTSYLQEVAKLSNEDLEWTAQREGGVGGRGLVGDNTQVVEEGYPLGTWYMREYAGLSPDGKWLFYTEAGGVTRLPEQAELRYLGNAQPDFEIGWSNYLTIYNNIDFNFSVRAVYGHQVFNTTRLFFANPRLLPTLNVIESALDENERGLDDIPRTSSYFLEDASFIRLDNLSIGYNLKDVSLFKNIRVYFASNNLFTITNYSGIDPEITYSGLSFGLDQYDVYPKTRTFTFGINFTL